MALVFYSSVPEDNPEDWSTELRRRLPNLDIRVWPDAGPLDDIDIALVFQAPPGMLSSFPNLGLVISLGAGVDHLLRLEDLPDVALARIVDDHLVETMREYVLLQVLRFHRLDHHYREQQRNKTWKPYLPRMAKQRRVGVMGLGALGAASAQTLAMNGFDVYGWSRSQKSIDNINCYAGNKELISFLRSAEILVCLLALTPETTGIINRQTLSLLPAQACLINGGRGGHVVEEDLLAALDTGHIAAAALDVFRTEPLPGDNPFWEHPRVFLTPHAATGTNAQSGAEHVAENIRRYYAGEQLVNTVDRTKGY